MNKAKNSSWVLLSAHSPTEGAPVFDPLTEAQMIEEQDHRAGWARPTVLPHLWGWGWPERRTSCRKHARPHLGRCLESYRTIPFSSPIGSQTLHHIWWAIWFRLDLTLGICHFSVDSIAATNADKSPSENDQKRGRVSHQLTYNKSCSSPTS